MTTSKRKNRPIHDVEELKAIIIQSRIEWLLTVGASKIAIKQLEKAERLLEQLFPFGKEFK